MATGIFKRRGGHEDQALSVNASEHYELFRDALRDAEPGFVMTESGTPFISVQRDDGTVRLGDSTLGQLLANGTFVFALAEARVVATLSDTGRVLVVADDGTDLDRIGGNLGALLREFGGRVESGYTIEPNGTATIPRGRPLSFDAKGHLSGSDVLVHGLTQETQRTALFIYVLVSTISP